jgi:hypothetical protein
MAGKEVSGYLSTLPAAGVSFSGIRRAGRKYLVRLASRKKMGVLSGLIAAIMGGQQRDRMNSHSFLEAQ